MVSERCGVLTDYQLLTMQKRRRSKRIRARVRIVVRVQGRNKETTCEDTHSLVVNAHGGLILLGASVGRDQFVTVINPKTGQELLARVTAIGTRMMGKAQVGIEFIRPAPEFWDISPWPEDWKRSVTAVARGS
ncbi:MAG: hypothetical protein ACRD8A_09655 [Candidatus Acidiferrales bacterium]